MSETKRDFLYLIWKDPKTRRNYIVGKLTRGSAYTFEYCEEYKEAKKAGWEYLKAFPENARYRSQNLFAAFASRLPDPKRRGIEGILRNYGLSEFDGYELLRKSTGRLPIDTYEFVEPIFPDDEAIDKNFYIVGIRHNASCRGQACGDLPAVALGDKLKLRPEPENKFDACAVSVHLSDGEMLGYIPRYYSKGVSERLADGVTYSCRIIEINQEQGCASCLRVNLKMPKRCER